MSTSRNLMKLATSAKKMINNVNNVRLSSSYCFGQRQHETIGQNKTMVDTINNNGNNVNDFGNNNNTSTCVIVVFLFLFSFFDFVQGSLNF